MEINKNVRWWLFWRTQMRNVDNSSQMSASSLFILPTQISFFFLPFPRNTGTMGTHIIFLSILLCSLEAKQEDTGVAGANYALPLPDCTEGLLAQVLDHPSSLSASQMPWQGGRMANRLNVIPLFPSLITTYSLSAITLYSDNSKIVTSKGTACVVPRPPGCLRTCDTQLDRKSWRAAYAPLTQLPGKQCHSSPHRCLGMKNVTRNDTTDYFYTSHEFTWRKNNLTRKETCSAANQISWRSSEEYNSATRRHSSMVPPDLPVLGPEWSWPSDILSRFEYWDFATSYWSRRLRWILDGVLWKENKHGFLSALGFKFLTSQLQG